MADLAWPSRRQDAAAPRVAGLTPARFAGEHVEANTPVVLAGAVAGSVDAREWGLSALARLLGDAPVRNVFVSATDRFLYFRQGGGGGDGRQPGLARESMPFAEFAARASAARGERLYLYGEDLPAAVAERVPPPAAVAGERLTSSMLWASATATCSPLHYDLSEGVLAQLHGTKRLLLFPHDACEDGADDPFYAYPVGHAHDRQSRVDDAVSPDAGRFPLYARRRAVQAVVGPGDAVFIPYGWYHQVESAGESVSVTWRWNPHEGALRAAAAGGSIPGLPAEAARRVHAGLLGAVPEHVARIARKRFVPPSARRQTKE